ncbi:MAG: FkbM family methyltransferase [Phycisphaerae bacterium]|nr:FkbM family methyltransferase [Phycisphaerae bacterium]
MSEVHEFSNGVRLRRDHLLPVQLERYAEINLHEPEEEAWITKMLDEIGEAGLFVDVGAAVGYYCFLVARLRPKFEIRAFEPDAANRARLAENRALNGNPTIRLHAQAVCDRIGSATLAGEGFMAMLAPGQGKPVPTTTLTEIAAGAGRPIDLLKMDIQGGEHAALIGAEGALKQRLIRRWIVGTHHPDLHAWCVDRFRGHKYRIVFEAAQVPHQPDGMIVAAAP